MIEIKCLSLHQYWASLMAVDLKRIETRSVKMSYRGWLAIHAAAVVPAYAAQAYANSPLIRDALRRLWGIRSAADLTKLPTGCIVCVTKLVDCVSTNYMHNLGSNTKWPEPGTIEYEAGNYGPNRYGLFTESVRSFKPIPARGTQILGWRPDPKLQELIIRAAKL